MTSTDRPARPAGPADRAGSSMSLLSDLFAHPVEPEYAEAARRRGREPGRQSPPRHGRSWPTVVAVVALGLLLAAAALEARRSDPVVTAERDSLVGRIEAGSERAVALEEQVGALQEELRELEGRRLAGAAVGEELASTLDRLELLAAASAVTGPGAVVTVDDAPPDAAGRVPEGGRVLDVDLQRLVNGLWAAGAEAVEVNGQRLTSLTAIRSASDVVLINYRPLAPPYEVRVVADSRTLPSRFLEGPGGAWLRTISSAHGIAFDVTTAEELTLSGGGPGTLRYAQPSEPS